MVYGRQRVRARSGIAALCMLLASCACEGGSGDGPEETLSRFLEAMDRSARDSDALRDAYALLSGDARAELKIRAERASALSGRDFQPWDMLAQGRFRLRFEPARSGGLRARIEGDRAVVVVRGAEAGEQAEVPMRRERAGWRVALSVPASRRKAAAPEPGEP
jgi:hypothetical protein